MALADLASRRRVAAILAATGLASILSTEESSASVRWWKREWKRRQRKNQKKKHKNKKNHLKADYDCEDFATQCEAQKFFEKHGGPRDDP